MNSHHFTFASMNHLNQLHDQLVCLFEFVDSSASQRQARQHGLSAIQLTVNKRIQSAVAKTVRLNHRLNRKHVITI
jgi:hypothetical protein